MITITPELKDKVLKVICNLPLEAHEEYNPDVFGIDSNTLHPILAQFKRMGFISGLGVFRTGTGGLSFRLTVHLEAHDYLFRGGFAAQEELYAKETQKLSLEIENLKLSLTGPVAR